MIYVDLNPIRARISQTLENSEHTSVKQRIEQIYPTKTSNHFNNTATVKLSSFIGSSLKKDGIAFALKDYLELADWTGRMVTEDKRGYIQSTTPGILQKLQLDEQTWMDTLQGFSKGFHSFVGPEQLLKSLCQNQNRRWVKGINVCRKLFKLKQFCPVPL